MWGSVEDIKKNIHTIDVYLEDAGWRDYAVGLIKRGTCFVVVKNGDELRFYPSRFIGYKDNNATAHSQNLRKDGRNTNAVIKAIFGHQPQQDDALEYEYKDFCERLGFRAIRSGTFGIARKYWRPIEN